MNKDNIDISVVIPAYNEEKILPKSLESLKNQKFSGTFEIIVVDNDSTDSTLIIAKKMGAKVIFEKIHRIAYARQAGFDNAKGSIIASTDADTIVPNDWLQKIFDTFQKDDKIIAISGNVRLFGAKSLRAAFFNLFIPLTKFLAWLMSRQGFFSGANFAIRKKNFIEIGGFNKKLSCGEDTELALRARKVGKIVFKNDIKVSTSARRYEGTKIIDVFKYNALNFYYLTFFHKQYVVPFKNIRSSHDSKISPAFLKKISIILAVILLISISAIYVVYAGVSPRNQILGKTYWHRKTAEKIIALTFDDGPNEPYTSQIMDILDKYKIKSTFFELGANVKYYPEITKKLYQDEQVIGNHSYSHDADLAIAGNNKMKSEIENTNDAIGQVISVCPHLFRPPHGYKSPFLLELLQKEDLATIEWSDMTNDYYKPGVDAIVKRIVSKARPGGIIVLHDGNKTIHGSDRSQTVEALPKIIDQLQAKGYHFVTIPELFNIPAYN